ncbi:MarR family winged helix-turn-helix transcriptional regulator [Pseudonocardia sp. WMMC193]|uniref:MarR family winged helix-turn-helix transcriptional regulator n=1 Tax=Pseudonocardia sp. WMMC193 TaxID=2911965 RepID=UPI001F00693D|nr:MarR family transcriptional regulator [Pseudonocardia sp. WMMC193]MCF7550542.1 MarR family transcriptional regulator [Pseudonocardia sp. WMMC193]
MSEAVSEPVPEPLDRLVSAAGTALTRLRARIVARHGLSPTALDVLEALVEPVATQRDLAARVGLTPTTLTPVLTDLEDRGLVVRDRERADRRVVRPRLTERGAATAEAVLAAVAREWRATLPGADGDEPTVRRYLERLVRAAR